MHPDYDISDEQLEKQRDFLRSELSRLFSKGRVTILIDHANLEFALKKLRFRFDYEKFLHDFQEVANLKGVYCFISYIPNDYKRGGFISFLEYNGYRVIRKETKGHFNFDAPENAEVIEDAEVLGDASGRVPAEPFRRIKGNVDVELTIYALEYCRHADHIVLVSGDGDFRMLIEQLQKNGKEVSVISTARTYPPVVADEVRRQADNFLDLDDLRVLFEKE
ncbi:NYN domain-containing protein [Acetobacteraceae bacterium ESL0709]|nr:NYN domain-containing protein [Acetobacteraceae bacterium ESL0697]MDF7678361.1 NYN domain-containing protein [Acetobacteraceae bacterium ESL0709]